MVKGVNRTVIEVHNTGSKYFEKIVFYVTPEYGNLSPKQLERASAQISPIFSQSLQQKSVGSLRKRCRKKQKRHLVLAAAICMAALGTVAVLFAIF